MLRFDYTYRLIWEKRAGNHVKPMFSEIDEQRNTGRNYSLS